MIAQDVLLGRPQATHQSATVESNAAGGGAARAVLAVLFLVVVLFEAATPDPLLQIGTYFHRGIGSWSGLPLILTPLELLIIAGVVVALGSAAFERRSGEAVKLGWPMLVFLGTLLLGFGRGALAGGDMYVGLWEIRYLLYVPACYFIARTSLRRTEHVTSILGLGLIAAALFALEGAYRKLALINAGLLAAAQDQSYEHDDGVFLATFLILGLSLFVFRATGRTRMLALLAAPLLSYTLLATNRRSGIIVFFVGLLVVGLTLFVVRRRAFFVGALPALAAVALVVVLFWDSSGLAGQPARAIRSLYEPDARDAASNFYRMLETYNVSETIHDDPILGVGFGREFRMIAALADLSWWPFWRYEPHNNVLWIWLKTGLAGYIAFWVLVGTAISRAAFAARHLNDQRLRPAALFSLVAVVGVVVYGYVDLAFISGRTTVLLGVALGVIAVIGSIDQGRDVSGNQLGRARAPASA